MGSGSSKEKTFGLSKEDHLLYSPKLLDLDHGTIRHRDRELVTEQSVRQGYFYHAQLTDWSDDACIKDFQKMHVVEGSKKDADKKLFYVYAKGLETDVVDQGIRKEKPKPKGLGYRWRGDSQHKYYRIRFSKFRDDEGSDSEAEELHGLDTVYRIQPKPALLAHHLSEILSLKLLIPEHYIHFVYKTDKIGDHTILEHLTQHYNNCKIELKLLTDVEIVKHGYDEDEPVETDERGNMAVADNHVVVAGSSLVVADDSEFYHSEDGIGDLDEVSRDSDSITRDSDSITRDFTAVPVDGEAAVLSGGVSPVSRANVTRDSEDVIVTRDSEDVTRDSEDVTRDSEDVTRDISEDVTRDIVPLEGTIDAENRDDLQVDGFNKDDAPPGPAILGSNDGTASHTQTREVGQSSLPGSII